MQKNNLHVLTIHAGYFGLFCRMGCVRIASMEPMTVVVASRANDIG